MSIEWDIEELAYRAIGMSASEAEDAINNKDIDEVLDKKYGVDFPQYCGIVKDLLPFTPRIQTAISGKLINAFVDNEEQRAIVKMEHITHGEG